MHRLKKKLVHGSSHRFVSSIALIILGPILLMGCPQSQKSTEDLLIDLKSSDIDTRLGAAFILGHREPEVVPFLISALQKEKEGNVRYWLIWSLKNLGTAQATNTIQHEIPFLQKEYEQRDKERKEMAALTLQMIGSQEALNIIGSDKTQEHLSLDSPLDL